MVDNEPTVLPEQGQEMREHTPRSQTPVPAPQRQTPEPPPWPWTSETHTVSGLEFLRLVMPQKPRQAAPTLREAGEAEINSDVDLEQQLLGESAGGDSLPDVHLPDVSLPDIPPPDVTLPDVPLPDVPLPDVPLPEARLDGSVGEEWISRCIAFGLQSGSCLVSFLWCNVFISGTD